MHVHGAFAVGGTTPLGLSRRDRGEATWQDSQPPRWPVPLALLGILVVSAGLWLGIFRLVAVLF
jgi:hypothetical protein